MEDKIKSAFDKIHAEDSLKDKTKDFISAKLYEEEKKSVKKFRQLPLALACSFVLLLGIGGYFSYATPVTAISLDINPSIELEVNIYDRIISAKGYNEDGIELSQSIDVENMKYQNGIDKIIESDYITDCLNEGNTLEVTVASNSEKRYKNVKECLTNKNNISSDYIYECSNNEDVETAHELGLSFGKYRAFLELQEVNPDITVDDVENLTMKEIRDMINGNSDSSSNSSSGEHNGNGNSGKGNSNGKGNAWGKNNK